VLLSGDGTTVGVPLTNTQQELHALRKSKLSYKGIFFSVAPYLVNTSL
jgi:hypothetical protein